MRAVRLMLVFIGLLLIGGCGDLEWFPDPPEVADFVFSPASVDGVATGSVQTSAAVTVAMTTPSAAISVSGGEYSVNGGAFTATAGTVVNGDQVAVRHTAASTSGGTVTTTLTIGGKSATFSSTTIGGAAPFSFSPTAVLNAIPGSTQTSNVANVTVTGTSTISVTGGEYALDGGGFTTQSGTISGGTHQVQLRHTAADGFLETTVATTLTIGGGSASFTSATGNVAEATVEVSGLGDTAPVGALTLQLVPGNYLIAIAADEGFGSYSLNGADGDYQVDEQFVTFTNGQVIHFQGFASPIPDDVVTTIFTIDGVPIVFNVRTLP